MDIYVGNLDFQVEENDLTSIFGEFGTVSSVKIIKDKYSGKSKGFGFVAMEDQEEAEKAIEQLNGSDLKDREIVVNEARKRD